MTRPTCKTENTMPYTADRCPNCNRMRVEKRGEKRVCEKCEWCIEDGTYFDALKEKRVQKLMDKPTSKTELKPCPFCGGDNVEVYYTGFVSYGRYIECGAAGTKGAFGHGFDAIKAWNTRAPVPALVEPEHTAQDERETEQAFAEYQE